MWNNFQPNFQPGYGQFGQVAQMPQMQPQRYGAMQRYGIVRLNGRAGAEALQMQPNDEVIAIDEHENVVWLIQSDGAGYKSIHPYAISEIAPEPQINNADLMARIERLENRINELDVEQIKQSGKRAKTTADET